VGPSGCERPVINPAAARNRYSRVSEVPLLKKPARRRTEVLVYATADKKWWRQSPVEPGKTTTKIHLGNDKTATGTRFSVLAMTTDEPLTRQTYVSLPDCRTKSEEIVLTRH